MDVAFSRSTCPGTAARRGRCWIRSRPWPNGWPGLSRSPASTTWRSSGIPWGRWLRLECAGWLGPRLRALALLGVAHKMPVHEDLLSAAMADNPQAFDLITSWGYGVAGHLGGNRAPGLWLMGGSERLLEHCGPGVLYNDLNACDLYKRALEGATGIECPCHLVLGANDRMTPAQGGRKLAEAIPRRHGDRHPGHRPHDDAGKAGRDPGCA